MGEVEPIRYFTEPEIMWLADMVTGEVAAQNIFHGVSIVSDGWHGYGRGRVVKTSHGASITLVGRHGYGRGRGHKIFHGASLTAVGWHAYGRCRVP